MEATTFWISPAGSDTNPGTQQQPFQTLEKARDTLRKLTAGGTQSCDYTIYLKDGVYRLNSTFELGPEDGGKNGFRISYKAADGAVPQIVGSVAVSGWTAWEENPEIYVASVSTGTKTRQLYVDGKRAVRARTTDYPEGFLPMYSDNASEDFGGIHYVPSVWNPAQWANPESWYCPGKVEAVLETQWKMMSVPVAACVQGKLIMQQTAWVNSNLYRDSSKNNKPGIWSFWRVGRFENDLSFLTDPGEWYLDEDQALLYYMPLPGEDLSGGHVQVELPVLEVLIEGKGTGSEPITNLSFEGLTFAYATWMEPSTEQGYVSDQSGYRVVGTGHTVSFNGHVKTVVKTPGNVRFSYAVNTSFTENTFRHLGAVGLDYDIGCKDNLISGNTFYDISSAAVQLGNVTVSDVPIPLSDEVSGNSIEENVIHHAAVEFIDAAGIFVGFSAFTTIARNYISHVHWSGIAMGWGWGLLDPDGYPGISQTNWFQWGKTNYHTVNRHNKICDNVIEHFLLTAWDGGSIYTTGYQGTCREDGLLIQGNTARYKNPQRGGNVFYTDGGSRWVILLDNLSEDNPQGFADFGPEPKDIAVFLLNDEFKAYLNEVFLTTILNRFPYGGDVGGCRTFGDILFLGNDGIDPEFYNVCPFSWQGVSYPTNLIFDNTNKDAFGTHWGGASYPPVNPVSSWHVPRISLPGIMGLQRDFINEWWYYVGVIHTDKGQSVGVIVNFIRANLAGIETGIGMLGLSWQSDGVSNSLHGLAMGLGCSEKMQPVKGTALNVSPVTDSDFCIDFTPQVEMVDIMYPVPTIDASHWRVCYTGGNLLGAVGSTYALTVNTWGYTTVSTGATILPAATSLSLEFIDRKGMIMENRGGVVGNSYECAQPILEVRPGGTLVIDGFEQTITGGTLWMDRQLLSGTVDGSNVPLSKEKNLFGFLLKSGGLFGGGTLYTGNWMGVTLYNGLSLVLVEFWQPHKQQWLSGTRIGKKQANPLQGGFGNVYFPETSPDFQANGGMYLRPRYALNQADSEWDYDVNLLDTSNGGKQSPHWQSPQTGNTYATAWKVEFSPQLQITGLPPVLYLFALSENAEIILTKDNAFFEGAALVYDQPSNDGQAMGQAFVEQMGYN